MVELFEQNIDICFRINYICRMPVRDLLAFILYRPRFRFLHIIP